MYWICNYSAPKKKGNYNEEPIPFNLKGEKTCTNILQTEKSNVSVSEPLI
jgi:hypothetical protein